MILDNMVRKPVVAGLFYADNFNALEHQVKGCFIEGSGLPEKKHEGKIKAAISPHAGLPYSGKAASHVYKKIAESELPDTFIIIGPNHTGLGYDSVLIDNMETPFGEVKVDIELAKEIVKETPLLLDSMSHVREHSVEIQLPFLQFVARDFKIVPIVISHIDYKKVGEGIKKAVKNLKRDVCVIASSDFIHHGYNYGFAPFKENISENVKEADKKAVELILKKDPENLMKFVEESGATICGIGPILILLNAVDFEKAELLEQYTSTDISGDEDSCVDYIGMIMK